jgi:hypothetical protein
LTELLKVGSWVEDEVARRHTRMMWEGLFFMFWHADKSVYQRDTALKIADLLRLIGREEFGASLDPR